MAKTNRKRPQQAVPANAGKQHQQLIGKSHQPKSIVQFFRESPLVGIHLNLERAKDEGQNIEL